MPNYFLNYRYLQHLHVWQSNHFTIQMLKGCSKVYHVLLPKCMSVHPETRGTEQCKLCKNFDFFLSIQFLAL